METVNACGSTRLGPPPPNVIGPKVQKHLVTECG
jgi:hypothetical protein